MAKVTRRTLVLLAVATFLTMPCWGVGLACEGVPYVRRQYHSQRFDSQAWNEAEPLARYDLATSLINTQRLNGLTADEVKHLLGEPMGEEHLEPGRMPRYDPGPNSASTWVWYYDIGHDKYGWHFGGALLAIDFQEERVTRVRRVLH